MESQGQINLNSRQQKILLQIARRTLEKYLKTQKTPLVKIADKQLSQRRAVFVTLKKNGQLRGCLGSFQSERPLFQEVQVKVVAAALSDPRFTPLSYRELKEIKIEISVLSLPQKINDWRKIKLGKHGVIIKKGLRGGTFLPQVAKETDWDLETFLSYLCFNKAGLPADCYRDSTVEIFIFTAQVFSE